MTTTREPLLSPCAPHPHSHSAHPHLTHVRTTSPTLSPCVEVDVEVQHGTHNHNHHHDRDVHPITPISIPIKSLDVDAPIHAHAGVYSAQWVAINPTVPTHTQLNHIITHRSIIPSARRYFSESYNFLQYNMGTVVSALCIYLICIMCITWIHALALRTAFPVTYNRINSGYLSGTDHLVDDMLVNPTLKHGWDRYRVIDSIRSAVGIIIQDHSHAWMSGADAIKTRWWGEQSPTPMPMNPTNTPVAEDITPVTWSRFLFSTAMVLIESVCFVTPAMASLYMGIFSAMRANAPLSLASLFSCFYSRVYFKLLPLSITLWIIQYTLTLSYVLPGIWFWCATCAVVPLYVQHHLILSRTETVRHSITLFHRYGFSLIPLAAATVGLTCLGILSFVVGLLISTPFVLVAWIYCYHHVIGVVGVTLFLPRWSPYLELMSSRVHHEDTCKALTLHHPAQDAL